jgi:hypothetical protein
MYPQWHLSCFLPFRDIAAALPLEQEVVHMARTTSRRYI